MTLIGLGFWISVGLGVLEVLGFISIGWWLVLAPLLVGIGLSVLVWVFAIVVALIIAAISSM